MFSCKTHGRTLSDTLEETGRRNQASVTYCVRLPGFTCGVPVMSALVLRPPERGSRRRQRASAARGVQILPRQPVFLSSHRGSRRGCFPSRFRPFVLCHDHRRHHYFWHARGCRVRLRGGFPRGTPSPALSFRQRRIKPFEALLRVKITRGVPVGTEFVSLRKLATPWRSLVRVWVWRVARAIWQAGQSNPHPASPCSAET